MASSGGTPVAGPPRPAAGGEAALPAPGWQSRLTPRRRRGPGRAAWLASATIHAAALVLAVVTARGLGQDLPEFRVYRVDIVSPPPQVAGEPEPVAQPAPKVVKPETTVRPEPERKPEPKPPPETPEEERPAEAKPTAGPRPEPTSAGGEGLDVRLEGEAFPFPGYLENIIRQINRYFRWTGAPGLSAQVYFVIRPDGSVEDIRVLRGSGNFQFDLAAMGAIELAGSRAKFGPLPEEFQGDRLPVSFEFIPPR